MDRQKGVLLGSGLFSDTAIDESVRDEVGTDLITSPVHSNPEKRVTSG